MNVLVRREAHNSAARGPKPRRTGPGQVGLWLFFLVSAAFFLMPLFVMLITSFKTMPEIRQGNLFELPHSLQLAAWSKAWSSACTGLQCTGLQVGFINSIRILVPSTILSIAVAAWTGYMLSFWRARGSTVLFAILLVGAFIPVQVFIYPIVRVFSTTGLFGTLPGIVIVHTAFGLPVLSLLFRNYFVSLPMDLFKAARVDGAGIWNDYILGVVFAGSANLPMTVQLNNIVNSAMGEKEYNVNMAATMITALVPLAVYFLSGRWFVRGIAAGAVKG